MERIISMFPWEIMENIYCNNRVNVSLSAWVIVINSSRISFFFFKFFFTLKYCIGFSIHQHESATGVHVFPILNPPPISLPSHPSGSSQCTSPEHPVSCIKPGLVICFTYDIIRFSAILPNHPTLALSQRVQKTVLYICVSFAVLLTGLLLPSF